jgi:hypothetical protein
MKKIFKVKLKVKVKVKVSPTTGHRDGPRGSGQVKAPDFLTFGTTRV